MEYSRALKSSVRVELTMHKQTQHVVFDDFLYVNLMNGAAAGDDFSVDSFFDFSNGQLEEEEEKDSVSISSQERVAVDDSNSNSSCFSFGSVLLNELSDDEIAGLEWLSHFVNDSVPELPLPCPAFKLQSENHAKTRFGSEPEPFFATTPLLSSPVPSKTRSKRAKTTSRIWSVGSMPLSDSSASSSKSSWFSMAWINIQNAELANDFAEPPTKKQKKKKNKPAVEASKLSSSGIGNPFRRRCSHCQVEKTPQWRTGPLGANTLCNACGVRYKSGRLLPEYRPACSPTFSSFMHSNSHREVLEMRKKRELEGKESDELTRMISSF